MSISDGEPGADPVADTTTAGTIAAEAPPAEAPAVDTRVPMRFTAAFWRYTVQVSRAGREDGDSIQVPGKLVAQIPGAGEKTWPAEVEIIKKDAKLRLDLRLSPDRATITVPMEDFALGRLTEKLKEYISGYGMALKLSFSAEDHDGRQLLESVDFAFSSEKLDD